MTKKEKLAALVLEVGGEEKARAITEALKFYTDKELTPSVVEGLLIECGFDFALPEVMERMRLPLSTDLLNHFRKMGL